MWFAGTLVIVLAGCQVVFPLVAPKDAVDDSNDDGLPVAANLVFITGSQFTGQLGGLAGADAKCNAAAMSMGLPPDFVAWLSVSGASGVNAIDRLSGSRGWMRADGQPVADLPASLGINGPLVPISYTETGLDVRTTLSFVWTGTDGQGIAGGATCSDWSTTGGTGKCGDPASGPGRFSSNGDKLCAISAHLYCFETGKLVAVTVPPPTDKIWFVTAGTWTPTGGVTAADSMCSSEATVAGLDPGFKALLPTLGTTLVERFGSTTSYVRPDGVRIGTLSNPMPNTFPSLTATGALATGEATVWTGGLPSSTGTAVSTCTDWSAAGVSGAVGDWHDSDARAYDQSASVACNVPRHLYCVQQ